MGFNDQHIKDYVTKFFNPAYTPDVNSSDKEECLDWLQKDSNLWSIAHIPIQLELLCSSYSSLHKQTNLILATLYESLWDKILNRYAVKDSPTFKLNPISAEELNKQHQIHIDYLEHLAFLGMQRQNILLKEDEIKAAYKSLSSEPKESKEFFDVIRKLGIVKLSNQNNKAEFIHLTFQEYFAASYIAKAIEAFHKKELHALNPSALMVFIETAKQERFYEVMWRFVFGLLAQKKSLALWQFGFDMLLQPPRVDFPLLELPLLVSIWAEADRPAIVQKEALERSIAEWLGFYSEGLEKEWALEKSLLHRLWQVVSGDKRLVVDYLERDALRKMGYEDKNVRGAATKMVGKLGAQASEAMKAQLLGLMKDESEWVRCDATSAVGQLGAQASEAMKAQLLGLMKDESDWVRRAAALAVGQLGAQASEVMRTQLLRLMKDERKWVRSATASAVGELGAQAGESLKTQMLGLMKDESWEVRSAAASAVGKLGAQAGESLKTQLLGLMKDESWEVRSAAASAVGELGAQASEAMKAQLLELMKDESEWWVRRAAASAVGQLGAQANESLKTQLLELMNDKSVWVRIEAVYVVGELGAQASESLKTQLQELMKYESWEVRSVAAFSVGQLGAHFIESLKTQLLGLMQDESKEVCDAAINSLCQIPQGFEKLCSAFFPNQPSAIQAPVIIIPVNFEAFSENLLKESSAMHFFDLKEFDFSSGKIKIGLNSLSLHQLRAERMQLILGYAFKSYQFIGIKEQGTLIPPHRDFHDNLKSFLVSLQNGIQQFEAKLLTHIKEPNPYLQTFEADWQFYERQTMTQLGMLKQKEHLLTPSLEQTHKEQLNLILNDIQQCFNSSLELADIELQQRVIRRLLSTHLGTLNKKVSTRSTCFISYSWGNPVNTRWVHQLDEDLKLAGIDVKFDVRDNQTGSIQVFLALIDTADFVIVIGTPDLKAKWENYATGGTSVHREGDNYRSNVVAWELDRIGNRMRKRGNNRHNVINLLLEGEHDNSFPPDFAINASDAFDYRARGDYLRRLFLLIEKLLPQYVNEVSSIKKIYEQQLAYILNAAREEVFAFYQLIEPSDGQLGDEHYHKELSEKIKETFIKLGKDDATLLLPFAADINSDEESQSMEICHQNNLFQLTRYEDSNQFFAEDVQKDGSDIINSYKVIMRDELSIKGKTKEEFALTSSALSKFERPFWLLFLKRVHDEFSILTFKNTYVFKLFNSYKTNASSPFNASHLLPAKELEVRPNNSSPITYDLVPDAHPIIHSITGGPIFRYFAYDGKEEKGYIDFYQHPLLCASPDRTRHNVFSATGIFVEVVKQIIPEHLLETCEAVPPTVWEEITLIANRNGIEGAKYGVMRGVSRVVTTQGIENGYSVDMAQVLGKIFFYVCFYFYQVSQQLVGSDRSVDGAILLRAAIITGQMAVMELMVTGLGSFCRQSSDYLAEQGLIRGSALVTRAGQTARAGLYGYQMYQQGALAMAVGTAAGVAAEQGVVHIVGAAKRVEQFRNGH